METIARNEYMLGEERDPTKCSLFYFALGKIRLVQGLWRQASWHPESNVMLKFLSNDFEQARWRTAALKNAFALLGKRRNGMFFHGCGKPKLISCSLPELAAAFFLLGGSLKDAVNVCVKQLGDFQLAVALARVVEGENGPVLTYLLKEVVIPIAFAEGNRWLGSWAFWTLNRRDLAVRILVVRGINNARCHRLKMEFRRHFLHTLAPWLRKALPLATLGSPTMTTLAWL